MQVLFYTTILLIVCSVTHGNDNDKLQCKDEHNEPVDWYVIYKLPKIKETSNFLVQQGVGYLYLTSKNNKNWIVSNWSIASNNSIPAITLAPLYNRANENKILWSLYNDSPPNASCASSFGHTKGVVMANSDQGFWLIHSVPKFPSPPDTGDRTRPLKKNNIIVTGKYNYPNSGTTYGQTFLCISLGRDQFNIVGKQLMYNEIPVYAKNIPEMIGKQYPALKNATNQKHIKQSPYNHKAVIKSLENLEFTSFAKSGKWGRDLYSDFVAPKLQSNLYVQSWSRGKIPPYCHDKKHVYTITSLRFMDPGVQVFYANSYDHSKWAIAQHNPSNQPDNSWVCIGDINRVETQFSRGGGTVCLKMLLLWKHFNDTINEAELCR